MYFVHQTALRLLTDSCPPGGFVVDAGAFPGTLTRLIREKGWRVLAFDHEPDRGVTLQQRFLQGESRETANPDGEPTFSQAMRRIGVEVEAVDLETSRYPLESGTVDAVVLTEVIEHLLVDPLHALTEINRILRRDMGVLLLSTPNLLSIRNRVNFLRGRIGRVIEHPVLAFLKKSRLGHYGHVRLYAPAELDTMLRLLGFEPRFFFHSFEDREFPVAESRKGDGPAGSTGHLAGAVPAAPARRSLLRKLIRSPRGYYDAGVATLRVGLEKVLPPCRAHTFILARKVREADYRDLTIDEVMAEIRDMIPE